MVKKIRKSTKSFRCNSRDRIKYLVFIEFLVLFLFWYPSENQHNKIANCQRKYCKIQWRYSNTNESMLKKKRIVSVAHDKLRMLFKQRWCIVLACSSHILPITAMPLFKYLKFSFSFLDQHEQEQSYLKKRYTSHSWRLAYSGQYSWLTRLNLAWALIHIIRNHHWTNPYLVEKLCQARISQLWTQPDRLTPQNECYI